MGDESILTTWQYKKSCFQCHPRENPLTWSPRRAGIKNLFSEVDSYFRGNDNQVNIIFKTTFGEKLTYFCFDGEGFESLLDSLSLYLG